MLEEKFAESCDEEFFYSSQRGQAIMHNMKDGIGIKACTVGEKNVKFSKHLSISWKFIER